MENSTREHRRYYAFVEWKNGSSAAEIHRKLVVAEGDRAPGLSSIYRWIDAFEHGKRSVKDEDRPGRPREAVTPTTIAKVEDLISDDRHITVKKLSEEVGISEDRVIHILHEELGLRKLCKKWIPHVLTDENKQKRIDCSRELLQILEGGFSNIITGDETWIRFYTLATKEANKVWLERGENRPQIVRTDQNSKKCMFCIFFLLRVL